MASTKHALTDVPAGQWGSLLTVQFMQCVHMSSMLHPQNDKQSDLLCVA